MKDSLIGKTIGKYQITEPLGRGGMAVVYKAYQPALDRYVAIKLMHSFLAEDEGFLARFQREAKTIATLRHPNIVQVYDFDVADGVYYYMVMEFVDGYTLKDTLAQLAEKGETLPLDETIRIVRDVASSLSYAHNHGMVHRDIKPSNVIINQENQVILTDFGIAKILSNPQYTSTGAMTGTPSYMSPEQGLGEPGDVRSDIYSLGTMLFQMVTGQLPYDADTAVAVVLKHINDPLPIPSQVNPTLPPDIEVTILKAMAKNPNDRFQTADELLEHLDQMQTSSSGTNTFSPYQTAALSAGSVEPSVAVFSDTLPPPSVHVTSLDDAVQLSPYTLSPQHVVAAPADLPAACDANWDRAVDHFIKGYFTDWLREGVTSLRTAHQHGLADELELVAVRAEAIVRRACQGKTITRNAGLEEFLELLGAPLPVMEVTPNKLNLQAVGVGKMGKPVTLTIANNGRGYLFGRVVCQVPWLEANAKGFGCAAGERCTVAIQPDLSRLPAGRIESANGLQIRSVGGEQTIPVQVDILPATLNVDASPLDFGTVGQGEAAEATLTVRNNGRGYLVGKVLCRVPWLKAMPEQFRVTAGQDAQIAVTVDSQALPAGDVTHSWALVIESNGGHTVLGVKMQVLSPTLHTEPERIDLGVVDLALHEAGPRAGLTVRNGGQGVLTGAVTPEDDWLTIEPAAFRCRAGETQQVRLSPNKLKPGNYRQTVHVVSNAGEREILVKLQVRFSLEPEMVRIPAGEFTRGSPDNDKTASAPEKPQRQLYLSEYWISKYPVTNAQYAAFVKATRRRPPEHWAGAYPPAGLENHPVVNVNWHDAMVYCRWLTEMTNKPYRLPTEAEWEKAARGPQGYTYPWGNRWRDGKCNSQKEGQKNTTPVGAYSPQGDSPYECADMAGNVWEWVADWYDANYYALSTVAKNPFGPASGASKVLRGGSWRARAWQVRCANRYTGNPTLTSPEVGFRCALALNST